MNAIVNNATTLLGACLVRALRWEGHKVTAVVRSLPEADWMSGDDGVRIVTSASDGADVLFETTEGTIAVVSDSAFARFSTGALLAPGDPGDSPLAQWIAGYFRSGRVQRAFGGARITDARDLALAMLEVAERRMSGHFSVGGPWMEYGDVLAHYERLTGREARGGGYVHLQPGVTTFFADPFPMTLRPLAETLGDTWRWHEFEARARVMVA